MSAASRPSGQAVNGILLIFDGLLASGHGRAVAVGPGHRKEVSVRLRILGLVILVGLFSRSAAATTVSIEPATSSVTQFDSFTVDIAIADVTDLIGFQFDVTFDPLLLSVNDVTEGPFLPGGGVTFFVPGDFTTTPGVISFTGDALIGLDPGVTGSGVLAHILFTANAPGTATLTLSNVLLQDSTFAEIETALASGRVTVAESDEPTPVPEPGTIVLIGTGLAAAYRRRANRAA
jgi:hypothetical protein